MNKAWVEAQNYPETMWDYLMAADVYESNDQLQLHQRIPCSLCFQPIVNHAKEVVNIFCSKHQFHNQCIANQSAKLKKPINTCLYCMHFSLPYSIIIIIIYYLLFVLSRYLL